MPRSLTVVGAGVIGIEYATIFSALDVPVTMIEPRDSFLDFIDREIIEEFIHDLRKRGMTIRLGAKVDQVELDEQGWAIAVLDDGRRIRTEMLLYAAGRVGATADLGLEACGLDRRRARPAQGRSGDLPDLVPAISTPPATSSAFPASPRPRWSRAASPRCHAFGASMPPAPRILPLRHLCRAGNLDRRPDRGAGARRRASPMNAASPASAKPRAATSWACNRA